MRVYPQPDQQSPQIAKDLKPGARIVFRVVEVRGDRLRVSTGGASRWVRFEHPAGVRAKVGLTYLGVVREPSRGSVLPLVTLRSTKPEVTDSNLAPSDRVADAAVRAFVEAGLPLRDDRLSMVRRLLAGSEGTERRMRARLLAMLEEKGLLVADNVRERLLAVFSSPEERGGGSDERPRHESPSHRDSEGAADDQDPDPSQTIADIHRSFEPSSTTEDPLALFNHTKSSSQHWIILPLVTPALPGLHASLAIRMPASEQPVRWSTSLSSAYLHVESESDSGRTRQVFALREGDRGVEVSHLSGEGLEMGEMEVILSRLGAVFHPGGMSKDSNTGFSESAAPDIIAHVDRTV